MNTVLILGGYGNFGCRIAKSLVKTGIHVIINGRSAAKAQKLIAAIKQEQPQANISAAIFDIEKELSSYLEKLKPRVVINTCGPFQLRDYTAAKDCIKQCCHYIDLADARVYVNNIQHLNESAKAAGVMVISGASTVPTLSSAVLEKYQSQFKQIDSLIYGIAPGQQTPRGLATTQAILTYIGKPLKKIGADRKSCYGWQDTYRQWYPVIGKRFMANCEVPDLDLFPKRYGIKKIRFSAGMESSLLHLSIWLCSWLVRLKLPINLVKHARLLLKMSYWFDRFGTTDGGMHMIISGTDLDGKPKTIKWFIIGLDGDGPQIPCIPAIVLAKKIIAGKISRAGAEAAVAMVTLDEYLAELEGLNVKTFTYS